jgi:very-short-patch-repair endonuclease
VEASTNFARQLRRSQTDAERVLWFRLRDRRVAGLKFKRQVPIDRFVVDFVCKDERLTIELDGGQHDQTKFVMPIEPRFSKPWAISF